MCSLHDPTGVVKIWLRHEQGVRVSAIDLYRTENVLRFVDLKRRFATDKPAWHSDAHDVMI